MQLSYLLLLCFFAGSYSNVFTFGGTKWLQKEPTSRSNMLDLRGGGEHTHSTYLIRGKKVMISKTAKKKKDKKKVKADKENEPSTSDAIVSAPLAIELKLLIICTQ